MRTPRRIDGMEKSEFYRELSLLTPIGDDTTIMVDDTPSGKVAKSIKTTGGTGKSVFNITPYWFVASISSATYVLVSDGYFIHGDTVEYKAQEFVLRSGLSTGYLSLLAYYRQFNDTWTFSYESSASFPVQTTHTRDGIDNFAERFPIAYIDFNTSIVSQINVKEIRTTRCG